MFIAPNAIPPVHIGGSYRLRSGSPIMTLLKYEPFTHSSGQKYHMLTLSQDLGEGVVRVARYNSYLFDFVGYK